MRISTDQGASPPGGAVRAAITVAVVGSHPLCRAGLIALLSAPDIVVLGEVAVSDHGFPLPGMRDADVAVFAAWGNEEEGIGLIQRLKEGSPRVSAIIVSGGGTAVSLSRAIAMGCSGYLGADVTAEELQGAVRTVARGECVFEPALLRRLLREVGRQLPGSAEGARAALTAPELEVLGLITEGCSNRQIAERLGYGVGTVKDYVQRIIQKMEVSDRTQAAVKAVRLGMFD